MLGLVLVFVAVVVLIVLAVKLFSWTSEARPVMKVSELRTGDRIYTVTPGVARYLFNGVGIQGGHAMMAVRDDDTGEALILDTTGYNDMPEGDTRPYLHPLADRTEDPDRSEFYVVWRYKGPHISTDRVREIAMKYAGNSFNYKFVEQHISQRWFGAKRDDNPKLCCSELLYVTLVELGLIKWDTSTWSDSFRYLQKQLPQYEGPYDLIEG